jgi:hypothetical protein
MFPENVGREGRRFLAIIKGAKKIFSGEIAPPSLTFLSWVLHPPVVLALTNVAFIHE